MSLGILATLAIIGMPWFSALMQSYRLNAATLQVASDLRYAQSLAVSNGGYYRFHWGNDALVNQSNSYRIEKSTNGTSWPVASATMASDPNVINSWMNIGTSYPGMTLTAVNDANNATLTGVVFNSRGSSSDPSPITLSISSTAGTSNTIQVRRTGSVKIL